MSDERYHHGDLRRALLDAALRHIDQDGPQGFSMSQLAKEVGVSSGAPYRHFKDKADLLSALALEGIGLAEQIILEEAARVGPGPLESFRARGIATVIFAIRHPAHLRVMYAPELMDVSAHPSLAQLLDTNDQAAEDLLAQAREDGEVDPTHPAATLLTAQATMYGLARLFVDGRLSPMSEAEARELAMQVTEVLGHGLQPRKG